MFATRAGLGRISPIVIALVLAALTGSMPANSQALLNQVNTIAAPTTGVPVQETFNVTTAGTYTITLTDLGAQLTPPAGPAPLASVELAVTNSKNALVGSTLVGAGTLTLSALPADTYQLHVVGMPGNLPGSGPIGIQVNGPGATPVASFQATIALPSQASPSGEGVLDTSFTVSNSGNYTVTLADLKLPQSLSTLTLLLIAQGSAVPLATLSGPGTTTSTNVALTAGVTYDLFAVGAAAPAPSVSAGLFSATIAPSGGGAVVIARTIPVGGTQLVGSPSLGAGNDTLVLNDLKYPAALSQLGAVLVLNGQVVANLGSAGSKAFAATPGTYSLFAAGTAPAAAPGAGSYAVQVLPAAGAPLFSAARGVVAAGSAVTPYSFDTALAAAGSYDAQLADFAFPQALVSLRLAAVQNGALAGTPLAAPGTLAFNGTAGPVSLLAFAQAGNAGGLFGIDLAPAAGGVAVFGVTQGVGTVFASQRVSITAAGSYKVTATDLGFPASFANFNTIVTGGSQSVGSIIGGGTFNFPASAGTYYINVLAQPMGAEAAGTYALNIVPVPPVPTVTLSADETQVNAGSTVNLTWSSQNATGCTASGGWTGSRAPSGTATSPALTASATFTLTCTGPGGPSAPASVAVTVKAAPAGGGGGTFDPALLVLLAGMARLRAHIAAARARPQAGTQR